MGTQIKELALGITKYLHTTSEKQSYEAYKIITLISVNGDKREWLSRPDPSSKQSAMQVR